MIDLSKLKTAEQKAEEAKQEAMETVSRQRKYAYAAESDPLFFKAQRGEATMEEWQVKVEEIQTRFPYLSEE